MSTIYSSRWRHFPSSAQEKGKLRLERCLDIVQNNRLRVHALRPRKLPPKLSPSWLASLPTRLDLQYGLRSHAVDRRCHRRQLEMPRTAAHTDQLEPKPTESNAFCRCVSHHLASQICKCPCFKDALEKLLSLPKRASTTGNRAIESSDAGKKDTELPSPLQKRTVPPYEKQCATPSKGNLTKSASGRTQPSDTINDSGRLETQTASQRTQAKPILNKYALVYVSCGMKGAEIVAAPVPDTKHHLLVQKVPVDEKFELNFRVAEKMARLDSKKPFKTSEREDALRVYTPPKTNMPSKLHLIQNKYPIFRPYRQKGQEAHYAQFERPASRATEAPAHSESHKMQPSTFETGEELPRPRTYRRLSARKVHPTQQVSWIQNTFQLLHASRQPAPQLHYLKVHQLTSPDAEKTPVDKLYQGHTETKDTFSTVTSTEPTTSGKHPTQTVTTPSSEYQSETSSVAATTEETGSETRPEESSPVPVTDEDTRFSSLAPLPRDSKSPRLDTVFSEARTTDPSTQDFTGTSSPRYTTSTAITESGLQSTGAERRARKPRLEIRHLEAVTLPGGEAATTLEAKTDAILAPEDASPRRVSFQLISPPQPEAEVIDQRKKIRENSEFTTMRREMPRLIQRIRQLHSYACAALPANVDTSRDDATFENLVNGVASMLETLFQRLDEAPEPSRELSAGYDDRAFPAKLATEQSETPRDLKHEATGIAKRLSQIYSHLSSNLAHDANREEFHKAMQRMCDILNDLHLSPVTDEDRKPEEYNSVEEETLALINRLRKLYSDAFAATPERRRLSLDKRFNTTIDQVLQLYANLHGELDKMLQASKTGDRDVKTAGRLSESTLPDRENLNLDQAAVVRRLSQRYMELASKLPDQVEKKEEEFHLAMAFVAQVLDSACQAASKEEKRHPKKPDSTRKSVERSAGDPSERRRGEVADLKRRMRQLYADSSANLPKDGQEEKKEEESHLAMAFVTQVLDSAGQAVSKEEKRHPKKPDSTRKSIERSAHDPSERRRGEVADLERRMRQLYADLSANLPKDGQEEKFGRALYSLAQVINDAFQKLAESESGKFGREKRKARQLVGKVRKLYREASTDMPKLRQSLTKEEFEDYVKRVTEMYENQFNRLEQTPRKLRRKPANVGKRMARFYSGLAAKLPKSCEEDEIMEMIDEVLAKAFDVLTVQKEREEESECARSLIDEVLAEALNEVAARKARRRRARSHSTSRSRRSRKLKSKAAKLFGKLTDHYMELSAQLPEKAREEEFRKATRIVSTVIDNAIEQVESKQVDIPERANSTEDGKKRYSWAMLNRVRILYAKAFAELPSKLRQSSKEDFNNAISVVADMYKDLFQNLEQMRVSQMELSSQMHSLNNARPVSASQIAQQERSDSADMSKRNRDVAVDKAGPEMKPSSTAKELAKLVARVNDLYEEVLEAKQGSPEAKMHAVRQMYTDLSAVLPAEEQVISQKKFTQAVQSVTTVLSEAVEMTNSISSRKSLGPVLPAREVKQVYGEAFAEMKARIAASSEESPAALIDGVNRMRKQLVRRLKVKPATNEPKEETTKQLGGHNKKNDAKMRSKPAKATTPEDNRNRMRGTGSAKQANMHQFTPQERAKEEGLSVTNIIGASKLQNTAAPKKTNSNGIAHTDDKRVEENRAGKTMGRIKIAEGEDPQRSAFQSSTKPSAETGEKPRVRTLRIAKTDNEPTRGKRLRRDTKVYLGSPLLIDPDDENFEEEKEKEAIDFPVSNEGSSGYENKYALHSKEADRSRVSAPGLGIKPKRPPCLILVKTRFTAAELVQKLTSQRGKKPGHRNSKSQASLGDFIERLYQKKERTQQLQHQAKAEQNQPPHNNYNNITFGQPSQNN